MLEQEIECDCFPGATALQACKKSLVDIGCLTPDMPYLEIIQKEPVVFDIGKFLTGEHDGDVALSQRLQPILDLRGKEGVFQKEPRLIENQKRWTAIEALFENISERD